MVFCAGKKIGRDILSNYDQIACCKGYDHNFVLDCNVAPVSADYVAVSKAVS